MIKAIIFDCFGVLNIEGFDAFRSRYVKPDQLPAANQIMDQLNVGQIDYDEFLNKLGRLTGATKAEILGELDKSVPNKPLFEYIRANLKPSYKIGLLSNSGSDWINEMFEKSDVELFDDIVLSYKYGMIKPDPKIFNMAATRLGVEVAECVLIDDKQKHAEGARQAGMQAILYRSFDQMKTELEEILAAGSDS